MSATKLKGKQAAVYRLLSEKGPMTCRQIAEAMTREALRPNISRGSLKAYYNVLHKLRNRNAVALYGGGWFALPFDGIVPYTKYNRVQKTAQNQRKENASRAKCGARLGPRASPVARRCAAATGAKREAVAMAGEVLI